MDDLAVEIAACIPYLRKIALRKLRDQEEAEDAVQETIVRAIASLPTFENRNLKAWLATILHSRVWLVWKRQKREIADKDGAYSAALWTPPTQETNIALLEVTSALLTLAPSDQALLTAIAAQFRRLREIRQRGQ